MDGYEEITLKVPGWLYKKFKKIAEDKHGETENALNLFLENALEWEVARMTAQTIVEQRRGLER
jgi:hypothetical protein